MYSRAAAAYATAAARIGQYGPVTDALFKGQESWEASGKLWEAVAAVLTPEQQKKVQALAKDPSVLKEVQADVDYGATVPVKETPTVYLSRGSQRYPLTRAALGYGLLKSLIDDLAK
jgi:protein-disulfide isomerase